MAERQAAEKNLRLHSYNKSRNRAKAKSLLLYCGQSMLCFLILGHLLSSGIFETLSWLWTLLSQLVTATKVLEGGGKHWAQNTGGASHWRGFGELLLGAPLGFGLSLLLDTRKTPLRSCLPVPLLRQRSLPNGTLINIPNRTFFRQPDSPPRVFRGRQRNSLFWFWLALGMGFLVILAVTALFSLALYLFPQWPTFQRDQVDSILVTYSSLQVFIVLVVVPVIFEELVFRGRGFALLARSWGSRHAAVISSLMFTLAHASPVEFVCLLPLAFYLGWLRHRTGCLAFTMLVHLENNIFVFLIQVIL